MNKSSTGLKLADFLGAQEIVDGQAGAVVCFHADLPNVLWTQVVVQDICNQPVCAVHDVFN